MKTNELETILKKIDFDDYFVEATFQFNLLMEFASLFNRNKIFPERSIKYYQLLKMTKKRIDIVLELDYNVAIELKMPMNGQVPEQMFKFIEDIKFLEELKSSGKFKMCYLIIVTKDHNFWTGKDCNGIYSYFRGNKEISGKIYKPTGEKKGKSHFRITGKYKSAWRNLNNNFMYNIIKI